MYSVSAPANACDTRMLPSEDRPKGPATSGDLQIVAGAQRNADFRNTLQSIDPSELAAKILQLHSDASEKTGSDIKRPKMVDNREEDLFDMPDVLRKPSPFERMNVASPQGTNKRREPPVDPSNGPSFKFLLVSTLMIGLAGGAALALGLPEMLGSEEAEVRPVETELIVTAPAIDAPSSATSDQGVARTEKPLAAVLAAATPAQIAKAKDRIRQAFAVGSSSAPAPVTLADTVSGGPAGAPPTTVQRVNDADGKTLVSNTEAAPVHSGYPILASNAPVTSLPDPSSLPKQEIGEASRTKPGVAADEGTTDNPAPAPVIQPGSAQHSASYPNAGRTLASVNMRQTEDKNGKIIAVIPKNTQISFNACGTWWCGIEYQGKEGFVGRKYLEQSGPQQAIEQIR